MPVFHGLIVKGITGQLAPMPIVVRRYTPSALFDWHKRSCRSTRTLGNRWTWRII